MVKVVIIVMWSWSLEKLRFLHQTDKPFKFLFQSDNCFQRRCLKLLKDIICRTKIKGHL